MYIKTTLLLYLYLHTWAKVYLFNLSAILKHSGYFKHSLALQMNSTFDILTDCDENMTIFRRIKREHMLLTDYTLWDIKRRKKEIRGH